MFNAVYPGLDWRTLTPSAFMARLRHADYIVRMKNGSWTDKEEVYRKADEDNRKILLMMKFKTIFREYEEIRG